MDLMQINFWLAVVNVCLLIYLAFTHIKLARNVKSGFTIGLLMFVIVFLIQNLLAAYFYLTMMELYAPGTELAVFVVTLIETIAFIIFTWISRH